VYRLPTVIALALREEHRLAADGAWYGSRTLFHGAQTNQKARIDTLKLCGLGNDDKRANGLGMNDWRR